MSTGRRRFLQGVLAAGALSTLLPAQLRAMSRLPAGRSIYRLQGDVRVNGQAAGKDTPIAAGDVIETGADARLVFVVGADAFLLRENTRIELAGEDRLVRVVRVITGAVLSVFGRGEKAIEGPTVVVGIRGTGVYLEAEPYRTYVCTCYGETVLTARADAQVREQIKSHHHDAPRIIIAEPGQPPRIDANVQMVNHRDVELVLLESLVGRTPPFDPDDYEPGRY